MPAIFVDPVLVALKRPHGYEDVHPELVAFDALNHSDPWPHEVVRDDGAEVVIALIRGEEYEGVPADEMAKEVINKTWPSWRLVEA